MEIEISDKVLVGHSIIIDTGEDYILVVNPSDLEWAKQACLDL